ncbi:MAG: FAD-binding oxidoreductase [Actinobacteria bacterium]|nr:FAD-binding oxidoreductase [Actinomycetota bacterium]
MDLPEGFVAELRRVCDMVDTEDRARAEAGVDWWPLGALWMLDQDDHSRRLPSLPGVVARPSRAEEVGAVLRLCSEHRVPVTPAAGRSGVCGAALPIHGGVALDLCALSGIVGVDGLSGVVDVRAGTFGDRFEAELRAGHGLTLGHWPQSMALSTVGGWLACRSAGQFSTRYGKIEDMVVGLEVAMADGSLVRTGGSPRAAVGPDLTQLFVGSEGTLGVITRALLRCRPLPAAEARAAYGFADFVSGIDACRHILRRGATPAVLRLYDPAESARSHHVNDKAVLLVLDEADPAIVAATMGIVAEECADAVRLDAALVEQWMGHRNDVAALGALLAKGWVVDTMEVSGPWSILTDLYRGMLDALGSVEGMRSASAHLSHSYLDGACLYVTFAARPPDPASGPAREQCYLDAWNAATGAVQASGAALSHHHGIGLNRHRFMADALGSALPVLNAVKSALDPAGVLNPGKLGQTGPFADLDWP